MDGYTLHLLGMAVEVSGGVSVIRRPNGTYSVAEGCNEDAAYGHTLSDALTALLRDLGVEVPERPSAERVEEAHRQMHDERIGMGFVNLADLRDLYAREPLTVLSLLEGGES